ncbi:AGAP002285-PA-like protein [Anopheles sinensis]|uniref:AGAP002285-PA-like protein n=1 Tax=Anopheles sinensis TaxID=74873 RepID=A0A084W9F0_ANOSI|nr:AGAP002285-PA-like protein [Anopheles sinensis]
MKPFVVIRKHENQDNVALQSLIKEFVMSGAWEAFMSCLFREITLQLIVLGWALMFIFFGIPLYMCAIAIPCVVVLIWFTVYGSYYNKSNELALRPNKLCWVAEVYEPLLSVDSKPQTTTIEKCFTDRPGPEVQQELGRMRKKIIGTISCRNHLAMENAGFITRLAVSPKYGLSPVTDYLIQRVLQHASDSQLYAIETVTSECDQDVREIYLKIGFNIRQVYHKQIIGNTLKVMKSQLGIDLHEWNQNREEINVEVPIE